MRSVLLSDPPASLEVPSLVESDSSFFEIIDGQRVEMPPMSMYGMVLANRLAYRLNVFGEASGQGAAYAEGLFHLPLPVDRNRRPDVAYVSYKRWPQDRPMPLTGNAWDVVPELAVEVTSPNDLVDDLITKIGEYFQAGVQLVWVIFSQAGQVYVFESPTQLKVLERGQTLDGGTVLPGFQIALADLFPPSVPA